jgi:hypothetical protein
MAAIGNTLHVENLTSRRGEVTVRVEAGPEQQYFAASWFDGRGCNVEAYTGPCWDRGYGTFRVHVENGPHAWEYVQPVRECDVDGQALRLRLYDDSKVENWDDFRLRCLYAANAWEYVRELPAGTLPELIR